MGYEYETDRNNISQYPKAASLIAKSEAESFCRKDALVLHPQLFKKLYLPLPNQMTQTYLSVNYGKYPEVSAQDPIINIYKFSDKVNAELKKRASLFNSHYDTY